MQYGIWDGSDICECFPSFCLVCYNGDLWEHIFGSIHQKIHLTQK